MAWDYELGLVGAKESRLRQLQPLQLARMISMDIGQLVMFVYRLVIKLGGGGVCWDWIIT
jgi:hypothetical protein